MILNELFKAKDGDFEYALIKNSAKVWEAVSILPDDTTLSVHAGSIAVNTGADFVSGPDTMWVVAFSREGRYDLTGGGHEIEIFKRVRFLLEKFNETRKPEYVLMTADEDNRASLYVKMLKRGLPGWRVFILKDDDDENTIYAVKKTIPIEKRGEKTILYLGPSFPEVGINNQGYETPFLDQMSLDQFKNIKVDVDAIRNYINTQD